MFYRSWRRERKPSLEGLIRGPGSETELYPARSQITERDVASYHMTHDLSKTIPPS